MNKIVTRKSAFISTLFAVFFGMFGMSLATPSIAGLWTAFDITSINSQVLTVLTTFVTINLGFLAYKFIRRTMGKG